ncbi:MAG: histidine kinase [Kiritimatiellia bacterium]
MRRRNQRKIARLETETALARERSRIARDMHDEVGARLSQLSVLYTSPATTTRPRGPPRAAPALPHRPAGRPGRQRGRLDHQSPQRHPRVPRRVPDPPRRQLPVSARHPPPPRGPESWPALAIRSQTRHELVLAFKEALQNVVTRPATRVDLSSIRDGRLVERGRRRRRAAPVAPAGRRQRYRQHEEPPGSLPGGSCEVSARSPRGVEVVFRMPLDPPPP